MKRALRDADDLGANENCTSKAQDDVLVREWQESPFYQVSIGETTNRMSANNDRSAFYQLHTGLAALGQILASAIQFGALLNRDHWDPWLRAINRFPKSGNLAWIAFDPQDGSHRVQRWFADRYTERLIQRWKNTKSKIHASASAEAALKLFLDKAFGGLISVDEFYVRARLRWHVRIPAVLIDKALGRLPSVAISESRWRKVIDHKYKNVRIVSRKYTTFAPREIYQCRQDLVTVTAHAWPEEHEIFDTVDKHFQWGSIDHAQWKSFAARLMGKLAEERSQKFAPRDYRALVPRWLKRRLSELRGTKEFMGHTPKVMRDQLAAIAIVLLEYSKAQEARRGRRPLPLSPNRLMRHFLRLDLADELQHALVENAVRDFSTYLVLGDRSEKPLPDYSNTTISASLISPKLYRDFIRELMMGAPIEWSPEWPFPPTQQELVVATIFAFRLGLRMRETTGLRLSNFLTVGDLFELHLCKTDMRPLKTKTSQRILPLDVLVPQSERQFILEWLQQRRAIASIIGKDINCFGPPTHRGTPNAGPYFRAFENVFKALDEPYLGYRHFRHSFSTYLFTILTLPSEHSEDFVPAKLRSEINFSRKREIAGRLLGEERLGQSALHAVSLAMGHTGIYRTLESYQHLIDFTLGLYVNDRACVDDDLRNLLLKAKLISEAELSPLDRERAPQRRKHVQDYVAPKRSDSQLSECASDPKFWGVDTYNQIVGDELEDRSFWEGILATSDHGYFSRPIEWSIIWNILRSPNIEEFRLDLHSLGISNDKICMLRRWEKKTHKKWVKQRSSSKPPYKYLGKEAIYHLNRLWHGYCSHRPTDRQREAIAHFVGGYDKTNLGAKMGAVERCLVLEDYLLKLGQQPADFDYSENAVHLDRWLESCPNSNKFRADRSRRVVVEYDNPRFRQRRLQEKDAFGYNADITRVLRENGQSNEAGAGHYKVTAAFNLFLYLVAASEGIAPATLRANSSDGKNEKDFRWRVSPERALEWREPSRAAESNSKKRGKKRSPNRTVKNRS